VESFKLYTFDPTKLFKVTKKNDQRLGFLNFQITDTEKTTVGSPQGIYAISFKNTLVYIGKHTAERADFTSRPKLHLQTFTNRFFELNYVRASKTKLLFDHKKNFNKILDMLDNYSISSEEFIKIKKIIDDEIALKLNEFSNKYKKIFFENLDYKVIEDTFSVLKNIKYNHPKKYIQMLSDQGCSQTVNRLKFTSLFWENFKSRNVDNIFNDFLLHYFKRETKEKLEKNVFEEKFEKKCILKFKPFANKENFNKYIQNKPSQINVIAIKSYLNELEI